MPRTYFTPGKDPVPILQEAGWAPEPVWTGGKSRPHRDSITDLQPVAQSLYRLSCPAHNYYHIAIIIIIIIITIKYVRNIYRQLDNEDGKFLWPSRGDLKAKILKVE